jgi:hypothetical protein
MKLATPLDRLGSSMRSGLREHWPVLVVAILGLTWVSLLFGQVYPFPSRTCNDDRQYLGVAHSIARGDGPHKRLIQEHYGGDVANMIALQRSKPEHEHVLGYHFPAYSAILATFLRLTSGSSFWAVFILNGLLYLTSIGLIYGIAYRLSRSPAVSSLAAGAFLVTPTVSNYVATTMVEMLAIALGLLLVYLAAKADSIKADVGFALLLSGATLARVSFIAIGFGFVFCRLLERDWRGVLSGLPAILLPLTAKYTVGKVGMFWWHLGHHPDTWSDVVKTFQVNLSHVVNYQFAFTGHGLHETYLYLGLIITLFAFGTLRHERTFRIAAFAHLFILAMVFFRYDWFGWCHIRVGLWYLPFAAVFMVVAASRSRTKLEKGLATVVVLAFVVLAGYENFHIAANKFPKQRAKMERVQKGGSNIARILADNYPNARFVAIPKGVACASIFDPERRYFSPAPFTNQAAPLLRLLGNGNAPDVAFVSKSDAKRLSVEGSLWMEHYKIAEHSSIGGVVFVQKH